MFNSVEGKKARVFFFSSIIFIALQAINSITPQLTLKHPLLLPSFPPPTPTPASRPSCFRMRLEEAQPQSDGSVLISGHGEWFVGRTKSGQVLLLHPGPNHIDQTDPIIQLHKCVDLQDAERFMKGIK